MNKQGTSATTISARRALARRALARRALARRALARRALARRALASTAFFTAVLTACGDDLPLAATPQPAKGIVVLDGYIQPGLTLLADSGSASSRITFGPSTEFDAGGFSMTRDTVLAVSSRGAGDLLYIADVKAGTMRRLQMPAQSNPGSARLLTGANGQALIAVALRDSSAIALVSVAGSAAPTSTRIANAGLCPTDVFQYDNATWVVDANANCKTNYAIVGDVRLIRIANAGATRDTITIPGMRGSSASAIVANDVAYISAGGNADFGSFPYTLVSSGRIAKINLRDKLVMQQLTMPAMSYGAGTKRGLDEYLYVSLYENLTSFQDRILKVRTSDMTIVTTSTTPWLTLKDTSGATMGCSSGTADALGRVHCLITGTGSVTSVVVFDPTGHEVRRVGAGQGGVDLGLR